MIDKPKKFKGLGKFYAKWEEIVQKITLSKLLKSMRNQAQETEKSGVNCTSNVLEDLIWHLAESFKIR